ncbi:type IX secretion system membrane protein PorP/SprF [Catalinimonas alkaloidigena]|nr:type IX secretion system membrane protein PorP/SprF [Catalinimonas alkaloidigena]
MTRLFLLFFAFFLTFLVRAQDPQYSQFYAIPMYMNPAFAGSAQVGRLSAIYRNQWPTLEANYTTFSAAADYYFPNAQSGVGLIATHDIQGFANLQSTEIAGQYAYQVDMTRTLRLRMGLQAAYVNRGVDYFGLTFGDQFDNRGFRRVPTGEVLSANRRSYGDISTGAVLFTPQFYMGLSGHHLNRPNQSFLGDREAASQLPIRYTFITGYKFALDPQTKRGLQRGQSFREVSFSPALLYMAQGKFDQLNLGMYLTYEPFVIGGWYRGLPIKQYEQGLQNNEALILLLGLNTQGLSIGYSYDVTISTLGFTTGGAHEISVTYTFPRPNERRGSLFQHGAGIPCPTY